VNNLTTTQNNPNRFRKDTLDEIEEEINDVLAALEAALPLFFQTATRQTLHFFIMQVKLGGPSFAHSMLIVECFNVFFKVSRCGRWLFLYHSAAIIIGSHYK
jgi:hypothetical protein